MPASQDPTEDIRRTMVAEINVEQAERDALTARYGQVWNTTELKDAYEVTGFLAPFIVVTRKSDGAKGSLMFQHSPRYYFSFTKD